MFAQKDQANPKKISLVNAHVSHSIPIECCLKTITSGFLRFPKMGVALLTLHMFHDFFTIQLSWHLEKYPCFVARPAL
jgi:hypothetical protein